MNRKAISYFSKQGRDVLEVLIEKLQKNTEEIKTLQGIIPICTSCKNIKDGKGYWNHLENYTREHYHAEFAPCICPECAKRFIWNLFNN